MHNFVSQDKAFRTHNADRGQGRARGMSRRAEPGGNARYPDDFGTGRTCCDLPEKDRLAAAGRLDVHSRATPWSET
jgi:hypothetical protein